ncbi:MAG: DUF4268 domain-containing protein [archaeon]
MSELGEIQEVDLRRQWQKEDREFTPWLSNNLDLIEEKLEIDLELKGTEVPVGSYNADIVAEPTQSEKGSVVIENQLGKSDHDHLGKIITYASGLDASYVVWICKEIQEEHKAAVDWLNENFSKDVGFLALEIKLWKIGESKTAPKFNVICKPDEWSKYVQSTASEELSETKRMQREFWSEFREYLEEKGTPLNPRKPKPQHWYSFSIGVRHFKISLTVNTREDKIGCELYISKEGSKKIRELKEWREEIEEKCKTKLDWQKLEEKKASRIAQYKDFDLYNQEEWEEAFKWLKERAETFHKVFKPKIKEIER